MCGRFTVTTKDTKSIADRFQVELEKALSKGHEGAASGAKESVKDGSTVAAGATDCAGARAPRDREFMAAIVRAERETYTPSRRSALSNTQMRPGASAPASRRVEPDRMRSGCKPTSRALVST